MDNPLKKKVEKKIVTSLIYVSTEDIFQPETLKLLRNEDEFEIKEMKSFIYGLCYSICKLKQVNIHLSFFFTSL